MNIPCEIPTDFGNADEIVIPEVIRIAESNLEEILKAVDQYKLPTVHCYYKTWEETKISLASSTYLWDIKTDHRSRLLYSEGIVALPDYQIVRWRDYARFTLYFEPLSSETKEFWFWEQTYEPYAFTAFGIRRNPQGVYWVELMTAPY